MCYMEGSSLKDHVSHDFICFSGWLKEGNQGALTAMGGILCKLTEFPEDDYRIVLQLDKYAKSSMDCPFDIAKLYGV